MKKLAVLLIIVFVSISSIAQTLNFPIDSTSGLITYTKVLNFDTASKTALYNASKEWITQHFNNPKNAVELADEYNGKFVLKAQIPIRIKYMGGSDFGVVNFKMILQSKNGKLKYTVTDFIHEYAFAKPTPVSEKVNPTKMMRQKDWDQVREQTYQVMAAFTSDIELGIKAILKENASF